MKKTLVVLAACLLTAVGAASAQSTDAAPMGRGNRMGQGRGNLTPEQRAEMQTKRLTTQLGLTADQTTKIQAIALAENQELTTLRGKYASADSRQGAGQEMKALRDKYETQLKAVLTPEQLTKYDQLRDERMDNRRDKMKAGGMKQKSL
jgi:Spy/CpxP family protein refolding chaperone